MSADPSLPVETPASSPPAVAPLDERHALKILAAICDPSAPHPPTDDAPTLRAAVLYFANLALLNDDKRLLAEANALTAQMAIRTIVPLTYTIDGPRIRDARRLASLAIDVIRKRTVVDRRSAVANTHTALQLAKRVESKGKGRK